VQIDKYEDLEELLKNFFDRKGKNRILLYGKFAVGLHLLVERSSILSEFDYKEFTGFHSTKSFEEHVFNSYNKNLIIKDLELHWTNKNTKSVLIKICNKKYKTHNNVPVLFIPNIDRCSLGRRFKDLNATKVFFNPTDSEISNFLSKPNNKPC